MRMGRVVGTVVATRKDPLLVGVKFLVVENLGIDLEPEGGYVVAVDAVGAGADEVVLYASGSSARQTELTRDRPVDAVIMAILDSFEAHGKTTRLAQCGCSDRGVRRRCDGTGCMSGLLSSHQHSGCGQHHTGEH